ncbi:MAG: RagB/SusD family nutrient uptake outer membrane protein [Prevotella sp.]|nr:RagB/SusD family nutrient uptake outer membrane protein [Prevotella sp.]
MSLAECEARVGNESNARSVLTELRSYRVLTGHESIPETVHSKDDLIKFCVDEQDREFMADIISFYNVRRLWNDPLFQYRKPYTHTDGTNTYTMNEENLYLRLPESVLKWNDQWRNDSDQK